MKIRSLTVIALLTLLAVPAVAVSAASHQGEVAKKKKKLSYCQKKGKQVKGKSVGKVKSAKFFLYTTKRPIEYFFCSESPKFSGRIQAWDGIKKTSSLRAVRNNCAIFYSEGKPSSSTFSGEKELKIVSTKYFRKGSEYPKQTSATRLGTKDETVSLGKLALSTNCVYAVGFVRDGKIFMKIAGIGDFPSQWILEAPIAGASAGDLKSISVAATSSSSATVNYTVGGAARSFLYTEATAKTVPDSF